MFSKIVREMIFHSNLTRMAGTLHEVLSTSIVISRSFLLRMRNVSDQRCRENQNTRFMTNNVPLSPSRKSCRFLDNLEKYGTAIQITDDNIIRHMRFACWVTEATDTH